MEIKKELFAEIKEAAGEAFREQTAQMMSSGIDLKKI